MILFSYNKDDDSAFNVIYKTYNLISEYLGRKVFYLPNHNSLDVRRSIIEDAIKFSDGKSDRCVYILCIVDVHSIDSLVEEEIDIMIKNNIKVYILSNKKDILLEWRYKDEKDKVIHVVYDREKDAVNNFKRIISDMDIYLDIHIMDSDMKSLVKLLFISLAILSFVPNK